LRREARRVNRKRMKDIAFKSLMAIVIGMIVVSFLAHRLFHLR